jgi:hypothetical protein
VMFHLDYLSCFLTVLDSTDAGTATEGARVSNRNAENRYPISPEFANEVLILTKTPFAGCLYHR